MSIFIYIYTYYVRNAELVCTAQTFSKIWIHSTPTLPWRFALGPQPLPACKAPWDISNQLCLGGDCERNTWPWNFRVCHQFILHNSTFETKRMCYYIWHELTFSVVKNFMFNFSIQSPKYHTVGLLVEKKNPVLPNFILVISFTLYIMYIISHIGFPKLLGFIQTHPLHRATDVLQLLVGREEPELHHVGTDLLELLNPERSRSTIRGPTGQFCFRIFDVDWRCFCPFLLWIRWIWYDSNSCSLI